MSLCGRSDGSAFIIVQIDVFSGFQNIVVRLIEFLVPTGIQALRKRKFSNQ